MTGDGTWTNTWDYRNQLLSSTDGTTTVTYQYDDAGNRVVQDGSGAARIYPNSYYSVDGTNVDRNILVGSLGSVATSTWNGTVATVIYHHTDHLGGTHVETDGNGATMEYIVYSPFGGTLVDVKTGAYENKHKYTGKEKDVDTGWYYYGARYYDAENGVFLSEDPMFAELGTNEKVMTVMLRDPQSQNSYAYARNNPSTLVDPNGECFWDLCIMEGTIAASVITWTAAAGLAVAVPLLMGAVDSYTHGNNAAGDQYMNATMSVYGAVGTVAGISMQNSSSSTASQSTAPKLENASGKTINGKVTIPNSWKETSTRGTGGRLYTNPNNSSENIRLMPGNPNSQYPVTQGPYYRQQVDGGYLDASGKINQDRAATHFTIDKIK